MQSNRDAAVTQSSYTNHLLIAMPALTDTDFSHSVTLVCEHSDKGALGIVLNKPSPMMLRDVLSQMKLAPRDEEIGAQIVLCGGPVRTDRGFVLHRPGRRLGFHPQGLRADPGDHFPGCPGRHGARRGSE